MKQDEHFSQPGHSGFLNGISVRLIGNIDPKDPTKWKDCWIHILKTKTPLKFNVDDGLQAKPFVFCVTDYFYGWTVFGQWFCYCFVGVVIVVSFFFHFVVLSFCILLLLLLLLYIH